MSGVKGVGEGELTAYRPLQKSPALLSWFVLLTEQSGCD